MSNKDSNRKQGTLYVVATPIGNLQDMTLRGLDVLRMVDAFVCEDTRKTGMLLKLLGVERQGRPMLALYDPVEATRLHKVLDWLQDGLQVALLSSAGTPLVSDPGFKLVRAATERAFRVVPVPGPCAAIAALQAAGLPTWRVVFMGFLPRGRAEARRTLEQMRSLKATYVFYCPARRLVSVLEQIAALFRSARVVVARELTKVHEEFVRGTSAECLEHFRKRRPKGEVTVLVDLTEAPGQQEAAPDHLDVEANGARTLGGPRGPGAR